MKIPPNESKVRAYFARIIPTDSEFKVALHKDLQKQHEYSYREGYRKGLVLGALQAAGISIASVWVLSWWLL